MSPPTRLLMDHAQVLFFSRVQWNLNLMNFCITKSSVLQNNDIPAAPVIVKYLEKNVNVTEPPYSEHIRLI